MQNVFRFGRSWHLALLLVVSLREASWAKVSTEQASSPLAAPLYYGVYVGGQKVGTMQSFQKKGSSPAWGIKLSAEVRAMGRLARIELNETRTYDAKGHLIALDFVQKADTGQVEVTARRTKGTSFSLRVKAGGQTQKSEVQIAETQADQLALETLAQQGKVGDSREAQHFDPSLQKSSRVVYTLVESTQRNIDGVATPCVKVAAAYPELAIEETSWLDRKGRLLESRIGGYFVARLEPKLIAEQREYTSDLLVGASVKAPQPLVSPKNLQELTLTVSGLAASRVPVEPWQSVRNVATESESPVEIQLRRVTPPAAPAPLQPLTHLPEAQAAAVREALLPTAFIQSDAPVLKRAATRAIRGQKDVMGASAALVSFVSSHLRSEYVPAYSNALEAFQSRRGDCTEHSVLFAALARAVGIPARVVVGVAYWPPGEGYGWHAWNEIWAVDRWIPVDPTWSQPIADVTHLKLAEGDPAAQARVIMLLGSLKIDAQQAR